MRKIDNVAEPDGAPVFQMQHDLRLRDWFAGQAMAAMLTGVVGKIGAAQDVHAYATGPCNAVIVDRAYVLADAMLEARKVQP
jgi:1,6-anhydro-N-acetylmuramate kinase